MDKYLEGTWEEFEEWIRNKIRSDFRWYVRARDTTTNREMVANLILNDIERCNGDSPARMRLSKESRTLMNGRSK